MTDVDKLVDGNDVTAVMSGELGDAIVTWLDACAAKAIEPRLSAKTSEVKLMAGLNSWVIACTPESMKAAMAAFKGDARFQRVGAKRNGFTSCMFLLSHPKDIPYVANGHTRGTHQTEGNTATRTLGSVAKAEAAKNKAFDKMNAAELTFNRAKETFAAAKAAIEDARTAEALNTAAKAEAAKAEALKDRAALLVKVAALKAKAAKAAQEAEALDKLLAEAEAA